MEVVVNKMKDHVYKRNKEELRKALDEMQNINKSLTKIIRKQNREYQQLYAEYVKLKKRLKEW